MSIFGDLTESDVDATPAEKTGTDLNHALAVPASLLGGWYLLATYLAVFSVLQVVQVYKKPTLKVIVNTILDILITVVMLFFTVLCVASFMSLAAFPVFILWGWIGALVGLILIYLYRRLQE